MQNNPFYQDLLDNLSDGVYFTDAERRITYFNKAAERITGYKREEVVGTRCSDNILVHVNEKGESLCVNGCPLAECICHDRKKEERIYLHHKNGHRVPVVVRVMPLKDEHNNIIGGAEIFNDASPKTELIDRIEELQKQALIDPLTLVGNRRYADIDLQIKFNEMRRYGWLFGIILVDLDNLKKINDQHGHETGDLSLKMVAKTMLNSVRASDLVCRWGGDEFIAITGAISPEMLYTMSERLRMLVGQSFMPAGKDIIQPTVSVGATMTRPDDTTETLFARADRLLYQSKQFGRNCTSTDSILPEMPAGK